MRRVGEFLLIALAVVVGLSRFGVFGSAADVPAAPRQYFAAQAALGAASNDPWSKDYVAPDPSELVYYRNCDAARAAGAAPIGIGEPGYRAEMDGDGDGTACEPYDGQ